MDKETNTETVDGLFLELSQFTKATTKKEVELQTRIAELEEQLAAAQESEKQLLAKVAKLQDSLNAGYTEAYQNGKKNGEEELRAKLNLFISNVRL